MHPRTGSKVSEARGLVCVDWQYGLKAEDPADIPYARLHSQSGRKIARHKDRTVEDIWCIDRLIGFLDFNERRYYLDPKERKLRCCKEDVLRGFTDHLQ